MQGLHAALAALQERTAFLPDYSFRKPAEAQKEPSETLTGQEHQAAQPDQAHVWKGSEAPKNPVGTSLSGLVGGTLSLGLAFLIGCALKRRKQIA